MVGVEILFHILYSRDLGKYVDLLQVTHIVTHKLF